MSKKKNVLKRVTYDDSPYFDEKDVDLLRRMIIICKS